MPRSTVSQYFRTMQPYLFRSLDQDLETHTKKHMEVIVALDMIEIERYLPFKSPFAVGRKLLDRAALARAFIAKAVLNLPTTAGLIDRLKVDRVLRRVCGFEGTLPSESTFSNAFKEFAKFEIAQHAHAALVQESYKEELVHHVSRDSTAIEGREKPIKKDSSKKNNENQEITEHSANSNDQEKGVQTLNDEKTEQKQKKKRGRPKKGVSPASDVTIKNYKQLEFNFSKIKTTDNQEKEVQALGNEKIEQKKKRKRGRPKKGEPPVSKIPTRIQRQLTMTLPEMLEDLPKACDVSGKKNSQGNTEWWIGYKLHLDVDDCGVPLAAIVTSASVHDSQVAIPLEMMTNARLSSLYTVMDSAYNSSEIEDVVRQGGKVPIIDPKKPRGSDKIPLDPPKQQRYKIRTSVERTNAAIKDDFGGRHVRVRGYAKVAAHLMFGVLTMSALRIAAHFV